jgi:hypothetical protein
MQPGATWRAGCSRQRAALDGRPAAVTVQLLGSMHTRRGGVDTGSVVPQQHIHQAVDDLQEAVGNLLGGLGSCIVGSPDAGMEVRAPPEERQRAKRHRRRLVMCVCGGEGGGRREFAHLSWAVGAWLHPAQQVGSHRLQLLAQQRQASQLDAQHRRCGGRRPERVPGLRWPHRRVRCLLPVQGWHPAPQPAPPAAAAAAAGGCRRRRQLEGLRPPLQTRLQAPPQQPPQPFSSTPRWAAGRARRLHLQRQLRCGIAGRALALVVDRKRERHCKGSAASGRAAGLAGTRRGGVQAGRTLDFDRGSARLYKHGWVACRHRRQRCEEGAQGHRWLACRQEGGEVSCGSGPLLLPALHAARARGCGCWCRPHPISSSTQTPTPPQPTCWQRVAVRITPPLLGQRAAHLSLHRGLGGGWESRRVGAGELDDQV